MLIIKNAIAIRPMQDHIHDYQLMEKWRSDEKVLQFYGGRDYPYDLEKVIETYQPRIVGKEAITPCIFVDKNLEIGYLQYYNLNKLPEDLRQMYCLENTDNVYGIDLFIGETEYWNQGIGTKVLLTAIDYIFNQLQAAKIVINPNVNNLRAIRCYEKCGFVKIKLLLCHDLHEGKYQDCWLMAIKRNNSLD
ncbi:MULTISPECIES: GNAT family N-acetyltransferase [unclassified Anabaena]|uniref:GNAT family N-acetyltransferase n=1 Tax=unclassified Anabaena TaxID=2619674 RepID=UPI001447CE02|nr:MULTISPECIES: GNAT family N-acetyltransferase [unclassified Anabaena]MTJ09943.1 GNAT family N-acetyltransferase [Anabaena sp. UHCC 0204]MTJ52997.1 GNAT family N-acetyltransferase [Anabaena sp. UHCC 0253]